MNRNWLPFLLCVLLSIPHTTPGATIPVGSGSYTTTFPGVDSAGRNGLPGGSPQLSGAAVGRPVPTNDWWSALLNTNHAGNLFNYPLAMGSKPSGLDIGYLVPVSVPNGSSEPRDPFDTIVVGVEGLAASRSTVDNYSDWTVTMAWASGNHTFKATSGVGMPFVYFSKGSEDVAKVTVNEGTPLVLDEILLVTNSQGGADFAIYAPDGSTWNQAGSTFTSTLNGFTYWSLAILPKGSTPQARALAWQAHAHVEPVNTTVSWSYDEANAVLRTEYTTTVIDHENSGGSVIQGLLPHQWAHLAADAPALTGDSLSSIRGELKLMASNTFATERTFQGVLPTLPAMGTQSETFDPAALSNKISTIKGDGLATWTDSYNEGQVMNRLIQTARIAHETGDLQARDQMVATVKERLEDWLTYEAGEVAFLFHYSTTWTTLFGYPAGHGQDTNINDHHFHWGYFIHAAAFMEQFEPGWASQWGGMVDLLIRDAASPDRADPLFPFLRNFSPYAGHAWANGFATFPFGNDQESTSESMQFNTSLIHWGAVTGNTAIRDLGIYLYTTEQSAVEEYWFDIHERNFKPGYGFALASRVWGNGYDNQTFWTSDIAAAYGIELYPIHGGSLYLGENIAYAERLWAEMAANTGVLNQAVNPNLWHDVYWKFLAFTNPTLALQLYNGNPSRNLKFGISDAQTYYWLHSMSALGRVDASVTADDPLAAVFLKNGTRTYVAHNYSNSPKVVTFSDQTTLQVPAGQLVTSEDPSVSGQITTPFTIAPVGGTVPLEITVTGNTSDLVRVEVFNGPQPIATLSQAPYSLQTDPLSAGVHTFYARLVTSTTDALTGLVSVTVGDQVPFTGVPASLPGTLEAGHFDRYEGGNGNGIAYFDTSLGNNGNYRTDEDVDAQTVNGEGATVGWIEAGEWLEYSVSVAEAGIYELSLRFASDVAGGGGPFHFSINGERISPDFSVPSTGDWGGFQTTTLGGIELRQGDHVLRLQVTDSGMNLGRMTFTRTGPLGYLPPVAHAGADQLVAPPAGQVQLDGSQSSFAGGSSLHWVQLFGPSVVSFSNTNTLNPTISGLDREGRYRFQFLVDEGNLKDTDTVDVLVGTISALPPAVAITSPFNNTQVVAGKPLTVSVTATDSDGTIEQVDLYNGSIHLGRLTEAPYSFSWSPPLGTHQLTATATDSQGISSTSTTVALTATPPASCRIASASGDFEAVFSADLENPTVTFIPSRAGVGNNIVIFYPGLGGVIIQPNVPYQFTASEGETISYYFTYSVPEGGERNTLGENTTFTIGSCVEAVETDPAIAWLDWLEEHFTLTELGNATLEATLWGPGADPDGDTLSNYLEFIMGTLPRGTSPMPLDLDWPSNGNELRIRFSRRAILPDTALGIEWSSDLNQWHQSGLTEAAVSLENGIEVLEVTLSPADPAAPIFLRSLMTPPAGN